MKFVDSIKDESRKSDGGSLSATQSDIEHSLNGKQIFPTPANADTPSQTNVSSVDSSSAYLDASNEQFECKLKELLCNGTCVPNNEKNCGNCGHDCTKLAHVTGPVDCDNETCVLTSSSCESGWADCSQGVENGCETNITRASNCGACENDCSETNTPLCTPKETDGEYECTADCPENAPTFCGDSCVDTENNPLHCGKCDHECKSITSGQAVCKDGKCDFECIDNDYLKCPDGCFLNDDKNCGACGNDCTENNKVCDGDGNCICEEEYYGTNCTVFFRGLGLPLTTDTEGYANALSADGSTVVGWSKGTFSVATAFRYRNGNNQSLGTLSPGLESKAKGVSSDGSIVVGDSFVPTGDGLASSIGFVWLGDDMISLGLLNFGTDSHANAVSTDGQVIVGHGNRDIDPRTIYWTRSALDTYVIDTFANTIDFFEPHAIDAKGSIAVGIVGGARPAMMATSQMDYTSLELLNGYISGAALSVSNHADVAAGYVANETQSRATRWTGEKVLDLGTLGGSSRALAMSADGSVIVGVSNGGPMIWNSTDGMRSLVSILHSMGVNLSKWTLYDAIGISDDGKTIAGNGQHGSRKEPWIVRLQ